MPPVRTEGEMLAEGIFRADSDEAQGAGLAVTFEDRHRVAERV